METSENKQYLVKLIPSRWRMGKTKYDFIKKKESYGVVFKISETGQLQYLWSTKGIYPEDRIKRKSFKIYLSNNGKSIIRVNENPTILISEKGKISAPDNDAITVFKKGKIIKKHSLESFISNSLMKQRRNTCGNMQWLKEKKMVNMFYFKTIDGKNWNINPKTGAASQS